MRLKRRRWTLILVPPEPGGQTRRFSFGRRHFATLGSLPLAVIGVAGLIAASDAADVALATEQLAESQRMVLALNDTVRSLRAVGVATSSIGAAPLGLMMPVAGEITSHFARSRFHPILQIFRPH